MHSTLDLTDPNDKAVYDEVKGMIKAIKLIRKKEGIKKGESPVVTITNTIECPVCGKLLYYTISDHNGHIWAECETEGCMKWAM